MNLKMKFILNILFLIKVFSFYVNTCRNISASGGVDACLSLIRNGIVTQGGTAVKESVSQMKCIIKNKDNESLKQVSCCLKQLIALLWNLWWVFIVVLNVFLLEKFKL